MKILNTCLISCLMAFSASAQVEGFECGSETPTYTWEQHLQRLISSASGNDAKSSSSGNNYVIPIIFHVIHGGEPVGTYPNILQDQIVSQVTILNQDYSGNSYNSSNYPINAFSSWAANQNIPFSNLDQNGRIKIADFNIQFCLASHDTNGAILNEPGIDRINYLSLGLSSPSLFASQEAMKTYLDQDLKPKTIWNVTQYLNVWVTDKNNALTYAGVSSVPPLSGLMDLPNNSTDTTDGVWCYTKATGSYSIFPSGNYISEFIDGRTLTHEVGHYLGLRHIWGDSACGTDFCEDTPSAAGQNTGTPTYPHNSGSCASPSNNPDGEMFMNFMDYTRGPSKYMFTTDQRARAHAVMQNSPFRNQLGSHNLCSAASAGYINPKLDEVTLFPNPASDLVHLRLGNEKIIRIKIYNTLGLLIGETGNNEIILSNFPNGIYFFQIETDKKTHSVRLSKQ